MGTASIGIIGKVGFHLWGSSWGVKYCRQTLSRLNSNHIHNKLLGPKAHK